MAWLIEMTISRKGTIVVIGFRVKWRISINPNPQIVVAPETVMWRRGILKFMKWR